jgi:hypothetical protein
MGKGRNMSFKHRKTNRTDETVGSDQPEFRHASGYTDLAGVLGEHTLSSEQEAAIVAPKGYRARSIAKPAPAPRR